MENSTVVVVIEIECVIVSSSQVNIHFIQAVEFIDEEYTYKTGKDGADV